MRMRVAAVGAAAACLLVLTSCTGTSAPERSESPARTTSTTSGSVSRTSEAAGSPDLKVRSWGVNDGLLSVVVVNRSRALVRSARAVITARDANGNSIATVSGPPSSRCCTILSLPPGGSFGLYAALGDAATRTRSVTVDYADVSMSAVAAAAPELDVTDAALQTDNGLAVVSATVSVKNLTGPYIAAQAFLTNAAGSLIAVVSGRFYCFDSTDSRVVRIQLFHPVPAGTKIKSVVAYPIPDDLPTTVTQLPACSAPEAQSTLATTTKAAPAPTKAARSTSKSSTQARARGKTKRAPSRRKGKNS